MKKNDKKKAKITGVRIVCWVLAGLMLVSSVALVVSAIISLF